MSDNEIDFDKEYFERSVRLKAEKLAVKDRDNEFSASDASEVSGFQIDGYYESRKEYHYNDLMRKASEEANQNIPIHVETAKTADAKAVRYKLKDSVDASQVDFSLDVAIDKFFDVKEVTVAQAKALESEGYFRSPIAAIGFAKGKQSVTSEMTADALIAKMNEQEVSVSDIAEMLGKKPDTVRSWTESGVPKSMTEKVVSILG